MSIINITQFANVSTTSKDSLLCAEAPFLASENVTGSGTSAQSSAFVAGCNFIRVCSDTDVRIVIGANPTATASSMKLIAGSPEYFGVTAGLKLATIDG